MRQPSKIAILEDDPDRVAEMKRCLSGSSLESGLIFFDNAPDMIAWLSSHLSETRLICLDHDLGPNRTRNEKVLDPGTGRDVADYLAGNAPVCPVLLHTTNTFAAPGMELALDDAGWSHSRVVPYNDTEWIQTTWIAAVTDLVAAHHPVLSARTLIIGLGNPLVTDDSVGLRVVEQLKPLLADRADVEVSEDYWGGLRLMERMIGFERAIVVDAIQTGAPPGTIHLLTPEGIATQRSASAHDVNLATALEFGRRAGAKLPENSRIQLVGIEAADTLTFGEHCTPAVEAAIPPAVAAVLQALAGE